MNPAISEHEAAGLVAEMFDHFCAATTMRQILGLYRNMCDILGLRPAPLNEFYPRFKSKIRNWKAQALWKKFDARASHRVYNKGTAANGTRVLVIGAGPCGLRTAIEAQLLGAKVVVVEKRDRISRNNVLHLWPFLITDLKALGAKKFYGKFCAGSIDHISIRQLQCILLKVALLLGVEVHEGVSFSHELEPKDGCGWRAAISPEDHAVSHYEFDVLIGADGKRNTLEGFKRKEFRGKLAIAITANFINKKTEAEAKVEEISGVAFIFNQSFFKELYQTTGIDLENIVYYKDETHYFVMTAKKHSLLDKGVIIQDYADPAELLSSANVDTSKLLDYAKEAANFSTKYQMPNLEFAVNHYGKPDVAMFDFTSMFAADNSCKMTVRKNYRLLSCLVGDSLLEPFWPTGSGCARGFLSSMDAAYAIKLFSNHKNSLLAVLAQRESIYRLLAQTTPENLHRDIGSYTLDPSTRYPNLNKASVNMIQVKHLLDTDDPALLEQTFLDTNALTATPEVTIAKRKRRTNDTVPLGIVLLRWVKSQLKENGFVQELSDASQCFTNGRVLCTLINRYRPDLVNLEELEGCAADECNEYAFAIFEDHLGIPRVMSGADSLALTSVDCKQWLNYLEQICEVFRGEIPHVKHPKLDYAEFKQKQQINSMEEFAKLRRFAANRMNPGALGTAQQQPAIAAAAGTVGVRKTSLYNEEERAKRSRKVLGAESSPIASPQTDTTKRAKKRRSYEKFGNIEERTRRLQEIESNRADRQTKRRLARAQQTQNFFTSLHMLQANTLLRESGEDGDSSGAFEDYSLFLYRQSAPVFNDRVKELEMKLRYPDRDRGLAAAYPRGLVGAGAAAVDGEQFSDRIRSMEQRIGGGRHASGTTEKKPKDLLRAIGKIDSNDWNVKEIEKKIELSKKATDIGKSRERVPKWNREQFLARQNKLTQQPDDEKYREFDSSIRAIDKQLKEGHNLDLGERGKNKVASIAGQLQSTKQQHHHQQQQNQKSTSKAALVLTASGVAEKCHFCKQRVYLMEKISAENLTLHRSCLKCHHCHTNLRLGGYAFDRDDPEGKFYCTQHFKLPSKTVKPVPKRSLPRTPQQQHQQRPAVSQSPAAVSTAIPAVGGPTQPSTPDAKSINFDLLDRGETPERIEFENADEAISDGEAAMEVIDENEWTDRNFGTESDESDSEEISSSDESESDSDSDYEEAAGSPLGAQTLQLASEWISDKRFSNMVDSDDDFYGYSSEDDEADSQTEGEELARAREMRMQEVKLMPPPTLPTDTETEVPPKPEPVAECTAAVPQSNQLRNPNEPCASSTATVNNPLPAPPPTPVESAEEKALREKMLQKLSVREQWLHSSTPSPPPQQFPPTGFGTPPNEPPKPAATKTSFFGGLMNSLSTLIKSDKQSSPKPKDSPPPVVVPPEVVVPPSPLPSVRALAQSAPKPPPSPTPSMKKLKQPEVPSSPTPSLKKHRKHKPATPSPTPSSGSYASAHPDDIAFEEVFKEDLKESNSSGRSTPRTKRRSRPKIREDADDFLEQIKQDQAALDRRMKKVEAQKFKSNMQSIKSAVEGPRIVGVKSEKDVSKFFTGAKVEAKPKQLPNKDVTALQGVNLAKYFPNANPATPITSAKASAGTPSSVSSVEGSPMLTRKKSSEVDLMKYFGPSTAKSSPSTPSSVASPAISRKNSVESPITVPKNPPKPSISSANLAPKPPVVPLPPKKNILAFQPIKKSSTESTIAPSTTPIKNALAFQPIAGKTPPSPKLSRKTKANSPPKKTPPPPRRKSPVSDEQLFDDLLKTIDKSPTPPKKLTKPATNIRSSPKPAKKPSPKRRSPDVDEQLFEDLLGEVDDSAVENFEEILGLPKTPSPKPAKKKLSPKQSPKSVKKPVPTAPKMTVKRPPFKITVPVKMQETLEEIYLASLSKLDTRSASSTSLNTIESTTHDPELGKVDEAFEALLQEPSTAKAEPLKIQPFQAPQRKPQQNGVAEGGKATKEEATKTTAVERTLGAPVLPVTPKVTKKIVEATPKLSTENVKQTEESPKLAPTPVLARKIGMTTPETTTPTSGTPVLARKVSNSTTDLPTAISNGVLTTSKNSSNSASTNQVIKTLPGASTPVLNRKIVNTNVETVSQASTPVLPKKTVSSVPATLTGTGTPTVVLAKNTVTNVSITATPVVVKNIEQPTPKTAVVDVVKTPVLTRKIAVKESEVQQKEKPELIMQQSQPKTASASSTPVLTRKVVVEKAIETPVVAQKKETVTATPTMTMKNEQFELIKQQQLPRTASASSTPVLTRKVIEKPIETPTVAQKKETAPATPTMVRKTEQSELIKQQPSPKTTTVSLTPVLTRKVAETPTVPQKKETVTATPTMVTKTEQSEQIKQQPSPKVASASSTPVLTRKVAVKEPEVQKTETKTVTPVMASKIEKSEPIKQQSSPKNASASSTPVLMRKNTSKDTHVVQETKTSPVAAKKIEKSELVKEQPSPKTASTTPTTVPTGNDAGKETVEVRKSPEPKRKLSSDEICFEELRKKHEAVFQNQLDQPKPEAQTVPLVDSKPVDVPRTLSEFRSSIICKQAATQDTAPAFGNKINELVMEIAPGANLDDMLDDDIPVPAERKKSSFQKMFHKLQRANTIAAMEAFALKPLAPSQTEYKMEVIREAPIKKRSPQPVVESKDLVKINLERTAQIKEQYAKQKALSPPKAAGKVDVERKGSFKIQPSTSKSVQQESAPVPAERRSPTKKQQPSQKLEPAPVPAERRSPTKKQLPATPKPLERTESLKVTPESAPKPMERRSPMKKQLSANVEKPVPPKPLERSTSLRVAGEVPKVVDRRQFKLASPVDIDEQCSILSRESSKPFDVDFDELFENVDSVEVVSFDDLLSSDDEVKPAVPAKTPMKNVVPAAVPVAPKVSEQKKPATVEKQVATPTVKQVVAAPAATSEQRKPTAVEKSATTNTAKASETKQGSATASTPVVQNKQEQATSRKLEQSEKIASKNPLSEKEFKQAAQQITEKFLTQPQEPSKEQRDFKTEAMFTVLTEATDISVKETDLFDSLCTSELNGSLKQDDMITKSTTSLSTLPDVVSMTQKPAIEETKPLKVLDYTDKIKQITQHPVPQEIQVYTLHTDEPQPSTSGVTNNYAHILRDITSGIVGSDLTMAVTYEPPPPAVDRKPKSDFTTYKQMLQEKSQQETPEPQQPQRPLRKPKAERSVSPFAMRPFDNSICIDPRRTKQRSSSIENVAIEQVFVKQEDKVIDTFYVVPEQPRQLKRRSKSYDRLEVPKARQAAKKSLDELRDYGFDVEPPSAVKHLVNPRLRHMNFEGSDDDLPSCRDQKRFERIRKCNSTSDTSKLDVEATRVDIDRESPIPRSTDFSKWEAILDRGVPYYKEPLHHKKEDIKMLERKLEDLKVERKPRKRFPSKTTIPKDYDPQEYVPRINRRFEEPDSDLPKWYDPEEYVPKAQRATMYETEVPVSRSQRNHDMEIPVSSARPQRTSAHEMEVPISRVGSKYYHEPMYMDDFPVSHTIPRSKTASHIPYSSVSSRSHDLPSREISKTQYSRRAKVDNSSIVSRSQRLHEKANKYIRSQISKNDPNPYIRELADSDDDDYHLPTTTSSSSYRTPITSSYHPVSAHGSSGSAAMSRITAKAITQPSRMTHYTRKDVPSTSSSYRRGGESSNRRDNCAIS